MYICKISLLTKSFKTVHVLVLLYKIVKAWRLRLSIASLAQRLKQAYKAVEIEAMAAIRALEFAAEISLDRVVVEGDSKIVTQALKTEDTG